MRVLEDQDRRRSPAAVAGHERVRGGVLVQDRDEDIEMSDEMLMVTKRKPTEEEWGELLFAMEDREVRSLERGRAVQRPRHGGDRRGADEPDRLGPNRGRVAAGIDLKGGDGVRRVLPVRGRPQLAIEPGSQRSFSRVARSVTTRWLTRL